MKAERKSDVIVEVIDGEKIAKEMTDKLMNCFPPQLPSEGKVRLDSGYGIVRTPKGTYLLDTEGFGPAESIEEVPAEIGITRADIMTAGSSWTLKISKENLAEFPISGKVNLAAFIRVFGNRLECNFNDWNKFLTKELKQT